MKRLLEAGADVNARTEQIASPLQVASSNGHEAVVKLLLDYGADIDAQNAQNANALQLASSSGHEAVVKLLLDHEAVSVTNSELFHPPPSPSIVI